MDGEEMIHSFRERKSVKAFISSIARTLILLLTAGSANASLHVCNDTFKDIFLYIGHDDQHVDSNGLGGYSVFNVLGWYTIKAGQCNLIMTLDLSGMKTYLYAEREDGVKWSDSDSDQTQICVPDVHTKWLQHFPADCSEENGFKFVDFKIINTNQLPHHVEHITKIDEKKPSIKIGTIQEKCIASWDDSHQVHSVDTIIELGYQAVKTRMKKLSHCIKLTASGPIEIQDVAKQYVDECINYGLNHQKTRHIIELLAAIAGDIYGGGGSLSAAKIVEYTNSASSEIVDCLTDEGRVSSYLSSYLKGQFGATVVHESHWVYWDL